MTGLSDAFFHPLLSLVTPDLIRGPASSGGARKAAGPRLGGRGDGGLSVRDRVFQMPLSYTVAGLA